MIKKFLLLTLVFLMALSVFSAQKIIYLTSLEWPPYSGEKISEQGAIVKIATEAFKVMGYELRVDFYPWQRAINSAKSEGKYVGYFPEYYAKDIEKNFIFSEPVGDGPLGFVELIKRPVKWTKLSDLSKMNIGIVSGYVNTEEFDDMVAKNLLKTESVNDDLTNIKKVGKGRIEMAVIDKYVMMYLLATEPSLSDVKNLVQFNSKPLENKKLYICFKKNAEGEKMAKIFNEGIKKIDSAKILKDYFNLILSK